MSMSEFERQEDGEEQVFFPSMLAGSDAPDDFTEEDRAFAEELHTLFSPEEENLPPYYVRTLLDGEDQRFEPVEREFAYKTSAHVFRRLKLHRRLYMSDTSLWHALSLRFGDGSARRSALTMVSGFILLLVFTILFTGGSFASGVAILLRGPSGSGVYQVPQYPAGVIHPQHSRQGQEASLKQISLLAAQQQLLFPLYSPACPPDYTLKHINLYNGVDQQWVNGAILEFEYTLASHSVFSRGTGKVWVHEFKPNANVLQVVKDGASQSIQVDQSGRASAIYVDGNWDASNQWVYGQQSELIYQMNGVVFWIVADQRDGMGEPQLMEIAQGLAPVHFSQEMRNLASAVDVTVRNEEVSGPFSSDGHIVITSSSDNGDGPYYMTVGSSIPPHGAR